MECSTPRLVNRKWMLCTLASLLGFLLLFLRLDQRRTTVPVLLESLNDLASDIDLSPGPNIQEVGVAPAKPNIEFSPQPSEAEEAPPPSKRKLAPQPSEIKIVPPESSKGLSPQSFEGLHSPQPNLEFPPKPYATGAPSLKINVETLPQSKDVSSVPLKVSMELHSESEGKTSSLLDSVDVVEDEAKGKCDLFDGKWVYDRKNYPLYRAHWCPFLSEQVSCQKNGRPDSDYEHWRWEPRGCKLPRFNGTHMLEMLRGKRIVMVGDSLNRNQWESLSCLLYSSTRRSRAFVKMKASDYKIFRALDYNCSVEFFWSPFLVKLKKTKEGAKVLKLDKLPASAKRWLGADSIMFNTGHWWTHRGKMRAWDYFEHNGEMAGEMESEAAFGTALQTWARWVDRRVDPVTTTVFFRSISPEHKRESQHWCYNQTQPITNETYVQWFPKSMRSIVERTINKMRTPVQYLNITRLSEYRRDGHASVYTTRQGTLLTIDQQRQPEEYADCSHWCLPGPPDTWNILLFASIIGTPSISL